MNNLNIFKDTKILSSIKDTLHCILHLDMNDVNRITNFFSYINVKRYKFT